MKSFYEMSVEEQFAEKQEDAQHVWFNGELLTLEQFKNEYKPVDCDACGECSECSEYEKDLNYFYKTLADQFDAHDLQRAYLSTAKLLKDEIGGSISLSAKSTSVYITTVGNFKVRIADHQVGEYIDHNTGQSESHPQPDYEWDHDESFETNVAEIKKAIEADEAD